MTTKLGLSFFDSNESSSLWKDILEVGHTSILLSRVPLSLAVVSQQFPQADLESQDISQDKLHLCVKIPTNQESVLAWLKDDLKQRPFLQSFELEIERGQVSSEMIYIACIYHKNHTKNDSLSVDEGSIIKNCIGNIITWNQFVKEVQFKLGLLPKYGD